MTDLDVFLPSIMPKVPGCPEPSAFFAIIKAAQEFCERTRVWRDNDTFQVTETSCNVVCAPDGADVFEIENALLDGKKLEPVSLGDLNRDHPDWREKSQGGRWITQIERDTVLVVPKTAGTLALSITLRPSDDAEQLPDFMAKHYRQVIADGALAEILMLPNQSFTDPARAQFYAARFEAKLSALFNRSIKGQQRAPTRSRAQFM